MDTKAARGERSLQGKYCVRLKVSAVDRESAWELCQLAVHYGGTEVCDCYFAFVDEERRALASAVMRLQLGSEYVEELDVVDHGTDVRLLFVAHEEQLREHCCRRLAQRGFLVSEADDGVECMEVLHSWRPAVVVLRDDILWGGSDGVLERMRQDSELANLPVVLLANNNSAKSNVLRRAGLTVACLWEPLVLDSLLNTIQYVASLRRPRR